MAWAASLSHAVRKGFRTERVFADPWTLARAVLAVAVGAVIGWATGNVLATTMMSVGTFICGIGTLLTPMRHRFVNALVMALAFSCAVALGVVVQPLHWYFLIVLAPVAFLGGLWWALGRAVGIRAYLVVIGLLITADISPGLSAGFDMTKWIAAGCALTVLAQLLPPYGRRYAAQRRKLADVYGFLASYARKEAEAVGTARPASVSFSAARSALGLLPQFARPAAAPLYGLLGEAERIRRTFYAEQGAKGVPYRAVAEALEAIARTVASGRPGKVPDECLRELAAWRGPLAESLLPKISEAQRLADLSVDLRRGDRPAPHEEVSALYSGAGPLSGGVRRLTAALRPGDPLFRHAVRVGVGTTVAEAAGRAVGDFWGHGLPAHGFWAALTTMLVLFPDYEHTFARGISRPIGTIAGGFVAWGLLQYHWGHGALAVAVVVFAVLSFTLLRTGQHVLNVVLTAWLVFLIHNIGTPEGPVAFGRPADTVLGALIAMVIFLLLPTWHHRHVPVLLARWLRLQARLLPVVLTGYSDVAAVDRAGLETLRTSVRRVHEELNEAIGKLAHEPRSHRGRWSEAELRRIMAGVNDLNHATALLAEHLPDREDEVVPELAEFAAPVGDHLAALSDAAGGGEPVRPGALREVFDLLSVSSGLAWLGDPESADGVSRVRARALSSCLGLVTAIESLTGGLDAAAGQPHGRGRTRHASGTAA
ncbi:FUSC family protein [Streptomyces lancefieldiae]|uniref:FUSC family protein n=1 Tax=Streptomyces lancefieldiae TaxID=3075520 RepID=A0ABU3AM38_9ACTN|nr:FUSC family protein [Streptomyces sp. DSM 40712]MDT0611013.1 FUSC family protein [Streptomyces sp. DSM 40712]